MSITSAEPVNEDFFCSPNATTITSSSTLSLLSMMMFMLALGETVMVFMPINESTSWSLFLTFFSSNLPLTSVRAPWSTPLILTYAPMTGSLFSSVTVPFTWSDWAKAQMVVSIITTKKYNLFLICLSYFDYSLYILSRGVYKRAGAGERRQPPEQITRYYSTGGTSEMLP